MGLTMVFDFSKATCVKDVFNIACNKLHFDERLVKKLETFKIEFITRNQDHADFFGGNLIGCYNVKFTNIDKIKVFEDILGIEERDVVKAIDKYIPSKYYKVAGDPFSLGLIWLAHRFLISDINPKQKIMGAKAALEILQYRFVTSRMYLHWQYQCSKAEAEATLASLNNKFSIKQKGSWIRYFSDRAEEIVSGSHRDTLLKMSPDMTKPGSRDPNSVSYTITDTKTRIANMLKNIFDVFLKIHEQGLKITSSSKISEIEGESVLKDDINTRNAHQTYILDIIKDSRAFIKEDLIVMIADAMPNMHRKNLLTTLEYISKNIGKDVAMYDLIVEVVEHAFIYLGSDVTNMKNDFGHLLTKLKGIYTSSRTIEPSLLNIRKSTERIVVKATHISTPAQVAATRTGVLLYVMFRTFAMGYYKHF